SVWLYCWSIVCIILHEIGYLLHDKISHPGKKKKKKNELIGGLTKLDSIIILFISPFSSFVFFFFFFFFLYLLSLKRELL
ncbi:uncharacterized protein BX663DRAFT_437460, partial [Cokeromyces recurvatus]|uniref:uncharacterized protein n=1 Tax=Cokeromyces recurvatus TaxID=90255 RepID=UPI00221EAAEB